MVKDTQARYLALAGNLRVLILSGELPVGSVLPRHVDLAQEHGVSKEAAADAVRALEAEGLVRSVQRAGTVVLPQGRTPLGLPGQRTDDQVLDHDWYEIELPARDRPGDWPLTPAVPTEVALLGDGTQVRAAVRLFGAAGRVEQILATWETGHEGQRLAWATKVGARMPTADEAKVLAAPGRYPLLRVLRVGRTRAGKVRAVTETLVTAQRYEVTVPPVPGHG